MLVKFCVIMTLEDEGAEVGPPVDESTIAHPVTGVANEVAAPVNPRMRTRTGVRSMTRHTFAK
jgi:hypothetical protein